jgi:tight adherence protein B
MLSLTLRVSIEYGGGVRQTLAGIVTAIRQREQAQRELRAMTGETRLSAWILGALPVGVALYVSAVNPTYLDHLWSDPGGRSILWVSLALQVIGSLLLWRMVRSIA